MTTPAVADTTSGRRNDDQLGEAISSINTLTAAPMQGERQVIASWRRNARETIQVAIDRFQDIDTIDLRTWYTDPDGRLKPTRSGLTLALNHLPRIAAVLALALDVARERGLLPKEDDGESQ